jgi:hypothetical protein
MRTYISSFFAFALAIGLGACGDSPSTANGTGGAGGAGGTGGVGTGGTGGGTMVSVTGTVASVTAEGEPTPLEGATVAVVGTANTAASDAQGNFSIMAPTGTVMFLVTANGHWGSLFADDVPGQGLMDLEAEVISDALVEGVGAQLGLLTPPSTSKGLVAVAFDDTTVEGGETASIDVNSGTAFIFDAQEDPMIGDTLVMGGGSDVIFIDVDVASEVTAMATNAGDAPCPLEHPSASYAVQAKVLTEIDVACPAQ